MKNSAKLFLVLSFLGIGTALYAVGEVKINSNLTVESDGTLVASGSATTWDDINVYPDATTRSQSNPPVMDLFKKNAGGTSQGVFLWGFSPTTEQEVYFNVQIPHSYKEGSILFPHVHWTTKTGTPLTNNVVWGLEYTLVKVSGTFGNTTILTGNTIIAGNGTPTGIGQHLITSLGEIAGTNIEISTILICRLYRIASDANDTFANNAYLLGFDIHYEKDTQGSRQDFSK